MSAPVFDLSAVNAFWPLHDRLARGEEVPDSTWDLLWATPAYRLLQEKEGRRRDLSAAFRLAFDPARAAGADSAEAAGGWTAFVLPHLREVTGHRDELRAYERTLADPALYEGARRLAQEYLPAGSTRAAPAPNVAFAYFVDARGYRESLLLDPLYLMRITNPVELLAHEFHHYYRSEVAAPSRPFGDDLLAWTLSTTESEGIAGMLDKADVPGLSEAELEAKYTIPRRLAYFREYQVEYHDSDRRLAQVDDVLERVAASPDSAAELGAWLHGELPDNGRIMGHFMAVTIERELGRDRLVGVVGRPFAFWRAYAEAARTADGRARVPSDSALAQIARVEARYADEGDNGPRNAGAGGA